MKYHTLYSESLINWEIY